MQEKTLCNEINDISMLSWTHEIFDYGLKDFVAAFVILIIRGY